MAPKKKINKKNLGTSFDRLLSYNLVDDDTIEDQMIELAEAIMSDCPVLLNFETVNFAARVHFFRHCKGNSFSKKC